MPNSETGDGRKVDPPCATYLNQWDYMGGYPMVIQSYYILT